MYVCVYILIPHDSSQFMSTDQSYNNCAYLIKLNKIETDLKPEQTTKNNKESQTSQKLI